MRNNQNKDQRQVRYENLLEKLENILEQYCDGKPFDRDCYLKTIYDIYLFFDSSENKDVIAKEEIGIIGKLGEIGGWMDYPSGIKEYDFEACMDVAKNLIAEIGEGFSRKYVDYHFDISRELHFCPSPVWADMRSFESFKADLLDLYYDEERDEDFEDFDESEEDDQ